MHRRSLVAVALPAIVLSALAATGIAANRDTESKGRFALRAETDLPAGYQPAALREQLGRYFVGMEAPAVADRVRASGGRLARTAQRSAADAARASQAAAIGQARSAGGDVVFRYDTLVNGFSATLSEDAARQLAERSDVASVEPVSI